MSLTADVANMRHVIERTVGMGATSRHPVPILILGDEIHPL
jgi:hypothetical protein